MAEREPLRVWHVDSGRRPGGGQIQISCLLKGLTQRGVACGLVCPPGSPLDRLALPANVPITHLGLRAEWDLWSAWHLKRLIRSYDPEILHAHDARAHTLCLLARYPGQRLIVHRRVSFPIRRHPLTAWKYGTRVDHFVAVAGCVRDQLLRVGVPKEKISVIHSAVDVSRLAGDQSEIESLRAELGLAKEATVIGSVGRLTKEKRHDWLLESLMPVLRDWPLARVVLVGAGPERSRLEHRVAQLGIGQQVVFAGYREDACRLLPLFNVFVLCSESEGYPVSLVEAMAAGCAVVCTDVGGTREIVTPGHDGILVSVHDPVAFREAVGGLLKDPNRRVALGHAARQSAHKHSGTEMMVDSVFDLYNHLRARSVCE